MLNKLIVIAALLLPACFAHAHEYKAGELEIAHPWSQELPPNAPTVAAYFIIHNTGKSADRLLSVNSPIAAQAQLHEHVMQGDLMKMQQVPSEQIPNLFTHSVPRKHRLWLRGWNVACNAIKAPN